MIDMGQLMRGEAGSFFLQALFMETGRWTFRAVEARDRLKLESVMAQGQLTVLMSL